MRLLPVGYETEPLRYKICGKTRRYSRKTGFPAETMFRVAFFLSHSSSRAKVCLFRVANISFYYSGRRKSRSRQAAMNPEYDASKGRFQHFYGYSLDVDTLLYPKAGYVISARSQSSVMFWAHLSVLPSIIRTACGLSFKMTKRYRTRKTLLDHFLEGTEDNWIDLLLSMSF
jgi:hypothetical protein